MLSLLFDFYYNLFYMGYAETEYSNILDNILGYQPTIAGIQFDDMGSYFALIASLISIIIILVLCCLFVFKIIKLIGGLIYR